MPDTPIQFDFAGGETLTVELYPDGSDAIANGAGDAATEATNRKGTYTITVAEALTGLHQLRIKADGVLAGMAWVYIAVDDTTTYYAELSRNQARLSQALDAYSTTRGLAGTALPAAVAGAAGGLPVSAGGGLDLDAALTALGVASTVDDSSVTPTATTFAGQSADLSATDDLYSSDGGMFVVFTSGALKGPPRPVVDYDGATRTITVSPAFPAVPSNGDSFVLIGQP